MGNPHNRTAQPNYFRKKTKLDNTFYFSVNPVKKEEDERRNTTPMVQRLSPYSPVDSINKVK
jgi:hypothetical protein